MAILPGVWSKIALAAFTYFVILGGTPAGDIDPALRTLNGVIAGALIVVYFFRAPKASDGLDRAMLVGLLLFAFACTLSLFPRQSFDAALAAVAYVSALFLMRGEMAEPERRRLLVAGLSMLSLALTLLFASLWLPRAVGWLSTTGELPPLALQYPTGWWGHRYDVAFLLLMLYPSWLIGRATPVRVSLAIVTGVLTLLIVLMSGSRTLWLAMAAGMVFALGPIARDYLRRHPPVGRAVVAISVASVAALIVTGLGAVIVNRTLASETITARGEMWAILTVGWLEHPLAGFGPGSFPWILQATGYFDTNSWAPRHPDSALFQLVSEAGLLGIAAAGVWIAAIGRAVWRSRDIAARLAVAIFAVASAATSSTDFGFLVILVLAWIAYADARVKSPQVAATASAATRYSALLAGQVVCAGIVILSYVSMTAAMYAYSAARIAISRGSFADARESLATSITLDPGMGLYWRQRGTLLLELGDSAGALSDLERAVRINPYDDLAWRITAVAQLEHGDDEAADTSIARAMDVQRSDATNLLLASWMANKVGDTRAAHNALAEVVQAWPAVTGAPLWRDVLPQDSSTAEVVAAAASRWIKGMPSPQPALDQVVWLIAIGGLDAEVPGPPANRLSPELTAATLGVLRCQDDAAELLTRIPKSERYSPTYWALTVHQMTQGNGVTEALSIHDALASNPLDDRTRPMILNPLNENGSADFSADVWGYRRRPVAWPEVGVTLPSPEWGYLRWIRSPGDALTGAGLHQELPDCQ